MEDYYFYQVIEGQDGLGRRRWVARVGDEYVDAGLWHTSPKPALANLFRTKAGAERTARRVWRRQQSIKFVPYETKEIRRMVLDNEST